MRAAQYSRALDDVATRSLPLPGPVDIDGLTAWLTKLDRLETDHAAFRAEIDATQRRWSCDEDMSR